MTDHPTHDEHTETFRRQFVSALVEAQNDVSLRQFLEREIAALRTEMNLKFKIADTNDKAIAEALRIKSDEDATHFSTLNNEAARILKATEITVSRDTWDSFKSEYGEWKSRTERLIDSCVKNDDYQTYKQETSGALKLRTGQLQGVGISWQTMLAIFLAFCAGMGLWSTLSRPSSVQPMSYTIPISPSQAPH